MMMQIDDRPRTKAQLFEHYDRKQVEKAQKRIKENVQLASRKKALNDSNMILAALKNHFIFYNLSQNELENIKERMFTCTVEEGVEVYETGHKGECFFIVETGELEVLEDGRIKKTLRNGDGFGEIALLYLTERTSTVRAVQQSNLWVIDRTTFRSSVEEVIIREYNENRKCLEGVRFFSQLSYEQKDIIASTLIQQKFYKGQNIIQEGDPGSSLYYIKDGVASVYKGDKFIRKLGRGDSFGEQSLYYNTMRQYTIKADDEVTCLVLGRDTLNRILGDKIYDVTFKNFIKWAFDKNPILSKLSKDNIENIIEEMKISSFKAHESIFRKGISGFQKLVVVIEGSLKKLKNGTIVATKGQCYGEEFLMADAKGKVMDDEIVMNTYGVIAEVGNTSFFDAIGSLSLEEVIKRDEQKKRRPLVNYRNQLLELSKQTPLTNYHFIQKIADGQFGEVHLVKDRHENLFCLKLYSKSVLQEYDVEKFISEERNVLQEVSFPFVLKIGRTFQMRSMLCFLNEYINGDNFYDVLKEIGLLSTEDCQFYMANIILLLEYFEEKYIICRDIKPENFMVDVSGFLKIINLSTAKISKSENNQILKTYTIIGTPHYMAPDIILGKGYNNLVDLWSLGVCLYEFICGVLPFGDSADGAYQIYQEIMQSQIRFPEFITDKKAKKLVEQLLSHNPDHRHAGSFLNLKSNPFFEDLDWNQFAQLKSNKLRPPHLPRGGMRKINPEAFKSNVSMLDVLENLDNKQVYHFQGRQRWEDFGEYIRN